MSERHWPIKHIRCGGIKRQRGTGLYDILYVEGLDVKGALVYRAYQTLRNSTSEKHMPKEHIRCEGIIRQKGTGR